MTSGNLALPVWFPIYQAPKDNKRPLYIAQFNESGELIEMDWNASWEAGSESWEIPQVYYVWMSANGRVEEPTHFAYMDYQPSPGGQGVDPGLAAVEFIAAANFDVPDGYVVEEHLPGIWHYTFTDAGEKMASCASWNNKAHATIAAWQAVLAARQPVELIAQKIGDYRVTVAEDAITVSRGRDIVFAYSADDPEPIMDRQPVGEPVEFDYPEFHQEGMGCGLEDRGITDRYEAMRYGFDEALDQMAAILESIGPLYAAPPAQAVDLGQFRKAVMVYRNFSRYNEAESDRLLALIDSQGKNQ